MKRLLPLLLMFCLFPFAASARGIAFDEAMHGYAYWQGEYRYADVYLHVHIADMDRWRQNPAYAANVTGSLYLERLPVQPVSGSLQILPPAPGDDGRLLTYRFAGSSVRFVGVKHVRDDHGIDVVDDMTTLRGVFLATGAPEPSIADLLYANAWTAEIRFEWWDAANLWSFASSLRTVDTPWYQDLAVKALFLDTVLGSLAREYFPWLY